MKKTTIRRLLALTLCLSLVSVCLIGGTLAKYTTEATANDSARVAKWGIVVTATGDGAFKNTYGTNDVVGAESAKVVAPGTSGTSAEITVDGTAAEVEAEVTYTVAVDLGTGWVIDTDTVYCPIVFTVDGDTYKMGDALSEGDTDGDDKISTTAELEAAVEAAAALQSDAAVVDGKIAAGTAQDITIPTISWAWAYEGDNASDTKLGNAATLATIAINQYLNITQAPVK